MMLMTIALVYTLSCAYVALLTAACFAPRPRRRRRHHSLFPGII